MKVNLFVVAVIATFALSHGVSYANDITASGKQKRGQGADGELSGEGFSIPAGQIGTITAVDGDCDGFWVEGKTVRIFKSTIAGIGAVFSAGSYRVYPNLRDNQNEADIGIAISLAPTTAPTASPGAAGSEGLPTFGPLGAGGMPGCLNELCAGGYSEGYLVLANTPYYVWSATKTVGQPYTQAPWVRSGPFTLQGGQRYIFRDGDVAPNIRPTSTAISPGLASLHYQNGLLHPVWYTYNPLPPGCGGPAGSEPATATSTNIVGTWRSSGSTWTISGSSSGGYFAQEKGYGNAKGPCNLTPSGSYLLKAVYKGGSATFEFHVSPDGRSIQGNWSDPTYGSGPFTWTRLN